MVLNGLSEELFNGFWFQMRCLSSCLTDFGLNGLSEELFDGFSSNDTTACVVCMILRPLGVLMNTCFYLFAWFYIYSENLSNY